VVRFVTIIVSAACVGVLATGAGASDRTPAAAVERDVLAEINELRAEHGRRPLRLNVRLARAARAHVREMTSRGYFSHASADGTTFDARVSRFYPRRSAAARWRTGENIAWRTGTPSARAFIRAWLASPSHRSNLLDARFRDAGVAVVTTASAPGVYAGRSVTVVTLDLGAR
jgi:uncharacterized protein YkwD